MGRQKQRPVCAFNRCSNLVHRMRNRFCSVACANKHKRQERSESDERERRRKIQEGVLRAAAQRGPESLAEEQERAREGLLAFLQRAPKNWYDKKNATLRKVNASPQMKARRAATAREVNANIDPNDRARISEIQSKSMKKTWAANREHMAQAARKNIRKATGRFLKAKGINKGEARLLKALPNNVHFVGDDVRHKMTFKDGVGKIPDFIIRGQSKVIELFGEYWHSPEEEKYVVEQYKKIGIECLVVWYRQLNHATFAKARGFCENRS